MLIPLYTQWKPKPSCIAVDFDSQNVRLKQASHWHEYCSRNAPQCGVPSRAILVARSLVKTARWRIVSRCRDRSCHVSSISHELFTKCVTPNVTRALNNFDVTSRDTLEIFFEIFKKICHHVLLFLQTRIATHPHAHCHEFFPHWQAIYCVPWRASVRLDLAKLQLWVKFD